MAVLTTHPFLNPEEARVYKERLYENRQRGIFGKDDQLIGAPMDYEDKLLPDYEKIIREHNAFMTKTFPDLLEKVKTFLENKTSAKSFYVEGLGLPGFRIFTIPPETKRKLWFHNDFLIDVLITRFPQLGVSKSSRLQTFIVLLDAPPGLTSGLLYFTDKGLGEKIMNYEVRRHSEFEEFADKKLYSPGEINIFEECVHSIYALNNSPETRERVTLQGHFVETSAGMLIFW
jgi:hypothetical protein